MEDSNTPATGGYAAGSVRPNPLAGLTAGIPPAKQGALQVLQFARPAQDPDVREAVVAAAREVSTYHALDESQRGRVGVMQVALEDFLVALMMCCPPGPERSTAISRARESKFWAAAAIALEGK